MGCLKMHLWRAALDRRLQETPRTKTPRIARRQSGKAEFGARCAEVVADIFGIGQKLGRHDRADRVAALIGGTGVARPVAEKARDGVAATDGQRAAKDIDAFVRCHVPPKAALIWRKMAMF